MGIKNETKKVVKQISEEMKFPQLKKEAKEHYGQLGKEVKEKVKKILPKKNK